jgi:7-cyano-7-deazaguanine synthase
MSGGARRGAVVLASGGIDSSVCLALACRRGGPVLALGFDYGQRNRIELDAERIAAWMGCESLVVPLDMSRWAPEAGGQRHSRGGRTGDEPSRRN